LLVVVIGGLLAGLATQAHAQPAEHVAPGGGMGQDGVGHASKNRPDNDTAARAMKELLCVCGCPRESIFDCKCQAAADNRGQVMAFINQLDPKTGKPMFDLATEQGRTRAYDAVLADFVSQYGGEHVLSTPRSKFSWLFPSLAVVGGLGLLFAVGRRWVSRGQTVAASNAGAASKLPEDETYADKLDDELAKTDD
jgi:cytochrome c-type biogenesis protein CcmH/NrfF